jgi:hypothetical protein
MPASIQIVGCQQTIIAALEKVHAGFDAEERICEKSTRSMAPRFTSMSIEVKS